MDLSLDAWAHRAGRRPEVLESFRVWLGSDARSRRPRAAWDKLITVFLREPVRG